MLTLSSVGCNFDLPVYVHQAQDILATYPMCSISKMSRREKLTAHLASRESPCSDTMYTNTVLFRDASAIMRPSGEKAAVWMGSVPSWRENTLSRVSASSTCQ